MTQRESGLRRPNRVVGCLDDVELALVEEEAVQAGRRASDHVRWVALANAAAVRQQQEGGQAGWMPPDPLRCAVHSVIAPCRSRTARATRVPAAARGADQPRHGRGHPDVPGVAGCGRQ